MSASPIVPPSDTERVEHLHSPPEPPALEHRVRLSRLQWIGVPLFALVPLLALAGIFDDRSIEIAREVGSLSVRAQVPQGLRQNRSGIVEVDLENRGDTPLAVEVAISPEYLEDCTAIDMAPPPYRAWAARLEPIAPGDRAQVRLEYEGERAGLHEGVIRVRDEHGAEVRMPIRTFVFP